MDLSTLFALPIPEISQARTIDGLAQTYTSWDDLTLDGLEATIALSERSVKELESQLKDSTVETPLYVRKASNQTKSLLQEAQDISLSRHELSDLVASLREQAEASDSSISKTDRGRTLVDQIEGLVREEKEGWIAVEYLGLIERVLRFRENILAPVPDPLSILPIYRSFLSFSLQLQSELPPQVSLGKLATEVVAQTWAKLKQTLSENLVEASKAISWPLKLTSPPPLPAQKAFEEAFLTLLSFQQQGYEIHGRPEKDEPLYPFEALVEPIRQRWRFHFESSRPTNRLDKPEWAFTHLLNLIHDLEEEVVDILGGLLRKGGVDEPDPLSLFITHLLPLPETFIIARIPHLLPPCHPSLLAHTIHQALVFDDQVRMTGYDPVGQGGKAGRENVWGGLAGVVLGRRDWFDAWLEGEEEFSQTEFQGILQSSNAFKYLAPSEIELDEDEDEDEDEDGAAGRSEDQWGAIWSSVELTKLIGQITSRYSPLPSPTYKLTFLLTIQTPLLHSYLTTLSGILDAVDRLTSTFARVVPGALAGHAGASGLGLGLEVEGFKGKRGLEKVTEVLIGARWIKNVLRKWGDELFFVDLLAEVVDDPYLRSKATDLLPPSDSINVDEHTLFDVPIDRFDALFGRAEDVMVRHICLEVESELKPHLTRRWDISSSSATTTVSDDPLSLPPTLISPLRILSTHLTYLSTHLPPTTLSSIYRRVVSHLTTYLSHRTIFGGWSKFTCLGGRAFQREIDGWIDTSKAALGGKIRRSEGPWRRLTDIARMLSIPSDDDDGDADVDADQGFTEQILGKDGERITLNVVKDVLAKESDEGLRDRLGLVELDTREVIEVLRRRTDWSV